MSAKFVPMVWEPILDGALADIAWAAAREATAELARMPDDRAPSPSIDLALFWAYAAAGFADDHAISERYDRAVDTLYDRFTEPQVPGLFGGSVGHAWVIAHVSEDTASLDAFDVAARDALDDAAARPGAYDLISGVVGVGAYFLERSRQGSNHAAAGLDRVVTALAARAERGVDGVTWFTPPELLPSWIREICPAGHHDLGVAHGVPGAVAVLAAIAAHEEVAGRAVARELATGALDWLQRRQLDDDPRGRYPTWVAQGRSAAIPSPRRTAWCYGDPGVAASCWRAAVDLGHDPLPWRTLAATSASRPAEHTGIVDPNLCHGAAGMAHLCNRFYQATREPAFRDAARGWFERALAMRPAEGIAGDFLDGTAGVVLALLAALRDQEPGWDRLLLCDVPVIRAVASASR